MSSDGNPDSLRADPDNDLLWRFDMRRLTAEEIRDSILTLRNNEASDILVEVDISETE